ncbi:MAG: N-acetylmuramoyl-L-alanine amidase [Candidatus Roizmanbacteria bacterium]|nr:N-acetylmuramoyl-L-alanine amidase [Candidatus Roizmanbacteria bacterium]
MKKIHNTIRSSFTTIFAFITTGLVLIISIVVFLVLFVVLRSGLTRAYNPTVTLQIKLQGEHFMPNTVKGTVTFYNSFQGKVKEWKDVDFQYNADKIHEAIISLDSSLPLSAFYAISIKPKGYMSRLFCSGIATGSACMSPQFIFTEKPPTILNLTAQSFAGGDIEPSNGRVDSYDISSIIADLGKVGKNLKGDVTGDEVVNIVDYAVALSSLTRNITDNIVPQIILSPPVTPTPKPSNTPIPTSTPLPTPTKTPTLTPSPTLTPTPTLKPTNTPTPTPTSMPQLGKNCTNGTTKVTKSISADWGLNVLPIPYGKTQYTCIKPESIVLHWSDSPQFLGNSATWGALNSKKVVCGLAIDQNEILQMSNFYDDKITWEGCSTLENSINIEINGTQFDLWYNLNCSIVNPTKNNALAPGELQEKKEEIATQYKISTSVLDWENEKYVTIMKNQEQRVLDTVRYLMTYYSIPLENITGHNKLVANPDPGERFLMCITQKLQ